MKRRRIILCSAVILFLVAVDQFSKLLVKFFAGDGAHAHAKFVSIGDSLLVAAHIHPELNDRYPLFADIVIALVCSVFLAVMLFYTLLGRKLLLHGIENADVVKSYPRFVGAAVCFWFAGVICSVIFDAFIWGGSLDFLCLEWYHYYIDSGTPYTDFFRLDIDLKDIFLTFGCFMIVARGTLWDISLRKLSKSDRKLVNRRTVHPFKALKDYKNSGEVAEQ